MIEEKIRVCDLFDCYHSFISEKAKSIMKQYYFSDMSFTEIAENENVSKQAVSDLITRTLTKFEKLESEIHLLEIKKTIVQLKFNKENSLILQKLRKLIIND